MINEVNNLIKRIRKQGVKVIIDILMGIALFRYYQVKCKILKIPIWKVPGSEDLRLIEKEIDRNGIVIKDLYLDKNEFEEFKNKFDFGKDYHCFKPYLFNEKMLEYFIAYKFCISQLNKNEIYIDAAARESPWAKLLREKGYNAYAIDLQCSLKYESLEYYKVMDATTTTFKDGSISAVSLQCAYEMFNRDDDIKFIHELKRILRKDGRALIVPFYMNTYYSGFSSPEYYFKKEFHDRDAKVYVASNNMRGIPFARFYDVKKFEDRVLATIEENNLKYNFYVLRNNKAIDQNIYWHFILEIIKED